jgi:hypothetical protein
MGDAVRQPDNLDSPTLLLRRLHRWRMAFFGLIILIAGLTTGAAMTFVVLGRRGPQPPAPPERAHQMMLGRIMPHLDLSPEQAEQVGPILRRHMQRLEEIREQGRRQITQELQALDDEMSIVLYADQQEQWQSLLQSLPGEFSRPLGPGRGGMGPRGPYGPRGGGAGRMRGFSEDRAPSPNDLPPQD